jgi:hypothetical protein
MMMSAGAGAARRTGSSTTIAKNSATLTWLSAACSLSDISGWRAGVLYPFAGGGRESGAAHFGLGGAMLLDPLGPMVRPPAAPSISILVIFRFGATMELGRSERTSHGVDAANTPDRKPR